MAVGRPRWRPGLCRQSERRRECRARERRQEGRSGLQLSLPEPRHDGAAQRHRALHAGQMRGLVRHAEWRSCVRGGARSLRPARRQMRRAQADARRRLRPARPDRLCPPGRADRQGDAGHADQAAVVARGGHDARPLPSGHAMQDDRRLRCRQQPDGIAYADFRPVDPVHAPAGGAGQRHGSLDLPGPQSQGRGRVRLFGAQSPDRPFDAQPAHHSGLLARRERQSQRDLCRMLHGRDWRMR